MLHMYCCLNACVYLVCVPDSRSFHAAVTKVKSGKGASAFSERTDDSSAMQYFQVLYVTIMSVSSFTCMCFSTRVYFKVIVVLLISLVIVDSAIMA